MLLTKSAKVSRRPAKAVLTRAAIADRLLDVELATVGALRSLQMDLEDDPGIPVETVLREARQVLKK
jgi:hypothetical protein